MKANCTVSGAVSGLVHHTTMHCSELCCSVWRFFFLSFAQFDWLYKSWEQNLTLHSSCVCHHFAAVSLTLSSNNNLSPVCQWNSQERRNVCPGFLIIFAFICYRVQKTCLEDISSEKKSDPCDVTEGSGSSPQPPQPPHPALLQEDSEDRLRLFLEKLNHAKDSGIQIKKKKSLRLELTWERSRKNISLWKRWKQAAACRISTKPRWRAKVTAPIAGAPAALTSLFPLFQ